jgi:hypothetical protein
MSKERFVGTWSLVSAEARLANGKVAHVYGDDPPGLIIYDSAGNVSVNFMRSDRPAFSVADKAKCAPEEAKSAIETYEAYFGTYEVDEARGTVTHHVRGSLLPNWTGSDQLRFYEFSDDLLILSTAEIPYSGTTLIGRLTWKRVS